MSDERPSRRKTHMAAERPPFEEANLHPHWVAGISIGAVNAALIAGNPPERRAERLREFWETVSVSPFGMPNFPFNDEVTRSVVNQIRSLGILLGGAPGFFKPRVPPPFLYPNGSPEALSYYDAAPLKATLQSLVDFDLINDKGLRVFREDDGGALEVGLQRCGAHAPPPRGAATA